MEAYPVSRAVEFVVRDTGPGIPEADLGRVFTPYWQAKKTAHMGAGLGLAIVKGIVDAHGGEVSAGNVPGGGRRSRSGCRRCSANARRSLIRVVAP